MFSDNSPPDLSAVPQHRRLLNRMQFHPFRAQQKAPLCDNTIAGIQAFEHGIEAIALSGSADGPHDEFVWFVCGQENNLLVADGLHCTLRNYWCCPFSNTQRSES